MALRVTIGMSVDGVKLDISSQSLVGVRRDLVSFYWKNGSLKLCATLSICDLDAALN